ncbi:MAG: dienelactone hydrolase family protein [Pseudomonadota bacterium]
MPDITITGPDGNFGAYIAVPEIKPAPAIIVSQEIFGVNQVMRDVCDWLAEEGFVACCPDLFWRIEPGIQITDQSDEEWARAFELFQAFDVDKGVEDLKTTISHCRGLPESTGKVGSIGYCLGGKLAFLMATRSDADCNVSYYGVGLDELVGEKDQITKPLMLHVAEKDGFFPAEAQAILSAGLSGHPQVTYHLYEGQDHAFARPKGAHYNLEAAELANGRSRAFLREHLS